MSAWTRAHNVFWGIGVSPGLRRGQVRVVKPKKIEATTVQVEAPQVEGEVTRFQTAVSASIAQLEKLKARIDKQSASNHYYILEAHQLMLSDDSMTTETVRLIREHQFSAEWATRIIVKRLVERFEEMDDEVFQRRASDIKEVGLRVMEHLSGEVTRGLENLQPDELIVAHNITPGDATQFYKNPVKGFVLEVGGRASHIAIIARSMEIPAVLGLEGMLEHVDDGDELIVDGNHGAVIVNPTAEQLEEYERQQLEHQRLERMLHSHIDEPSVTTDGTSVVLKGNIESEEEMGSLAEHGAQGIGLFRTEFLYMNRQQPPSEAEHFEVYKTLAEQCNCGPVTIRTLDIGGDKLPVYWPITDDANPALGIRAVRTIYSNERYFIDQVRAIYRASAFGEIKLLLPFISGVGELEQVLEILRQVRRDLKHEGVDYNPDVPIGIMIELPSAAILSDVLATMVDFFSIGTNDLVQYTLAVDRDAEQLSHLYTPLHPAILRMIRMTCDNASQAGIGVAVCGEMAGSGLNTLLLLGLGVTELDMPPAAIPYVKEIIRTTSLHEARALAKRALAVSTSAKVEETVHTEMTRRWPQFFGEDVG